MSDIYREECVQNKLSSSTFQELKGKYNRFDYAVNKIVVKTIY